MQKSLQLTGIALGCALALNPAFASCIVGVLREEAEDVADREWWRQGEARGFNELISTIRFGSRSAGSSGDTDFRIGRLERKVVARDPHTFAKIETMGRMSLHT